MADKPTDLDGAKQGAAMLAVCIVRTAEELIPTFQVRFLQKLREARTRLEDRDLEHEQHVLAMAQELLTSVDFQPGARGKPFPEGF
jgi:hypothetical protein